MLIAFARGRKWLLGLLAIGLAAPILTASAAILMVYDRGALWPVVQACVADARLTGLSFPCLKTELKGGDGGGYVVLRPPWSNDMILSPTRRLVGLEDPNLQSQDVPNYFAAAWRQRGLIATANGRPAARGQVALIVNSRLVRGQDQLHIHIGCLAADVQTAVRTIAPRLPLQDWRLISGIMPHQPFWTLRVGGSDLDGVDPFRLVAERFGEQGQNLADMMIAVVGAEVDGAGNFLILVSSVGMPGSWWPVGAEDFIEAKCLGEEDEAAQATVRPIGDPGLREGGN